MSYWTFVDMNSYFASCEQQDRPELRGRPVGVAPVMAETTCFIAASYEAKRYGIKTGTPVWEARKICPSIAVVEARPELYRRMHYQIVEAVNSVIPVETVLSVDEMVCKPWKNEATLADSLRLGQRIQDEIRLQVGEWMQCSVGIAPNAFLAKVASDFQKPRGLSVITPDDIPHKLYFLALTDWPGIAGGRAERFRKWDVHTTEQMYALPLKDMIQVFGGIEGERWWRSLRGETVALPPIKTWSVSHNTVIAPEHRTPDKAFAIACRNLEKAASRMRAGHYHAQAMQVDIVTADGPWRRRVTFYPCNRTRRFIELLRELWTPPHLVPKSAGATFQNLVKDSDVTVSLFDNFDQPNIDEVIDRLNQKFGPGCIVSGSALPAKEYLSHVRIPFGKPSELR
jgi:DNA polymerase-4